jgi:SAM-dependent methyltransferase
VKESAYIEKQRRFYAGGAHEHLQAQEGDFHSQKLSKRVAAGLALSGTESVLEVGAGFGRFTFLLLEHCERVLALDLTQRALDTLAKARDERGISSERCRTLCADVNQFGGSSDPISALTAGEQARRFDRVVGFFFLHHLPDFESSIARLAGQLAPGGRMAFLEPNRLNPLFAVQLTACPDMNWSDEKGLYSLTPRKIETALRNAGLVDTSTQRFGFFPPQIFNRSEAARRFEARCESAPWLQWLLPFHFVSARAPEQGER